MIELRIVKILMVGSLALFTLAVTFGNLTDYGSNFAFVQHVLSMDTTFPGNALMGRAVTNPTLWNLFYAGIIATEALTGIAFAAATIILLTRLRAPAREFNRAKRLAYVGVGLGFLLWFFGFMVIGGEWFAMWQSQQWNGQNAAFRFYATILAVAIFLHFDDGELRA